jgi:transposase-like protein
MAKRRRFTPEFKAQVVLEILNGLKTTAEVCREHKLQAQVVNRWKSVFLEQAPTIFERASGQTGEQQRVAELERLVGRLAMELEVAKKASSILQSHLDGKERWR